MFRECCLPLLSEARLTWPGIGRDQSPCLGSHVHWISQARAKSMENMPPEHPAKGRRFCCFRGERQLVESAWQRTGVSHSATIKVSKQRPSRRHRKLMGRTRSEERRVGKECR